MMHHRTGGVGRQEEEGEEKKRGKEVRKSWRTEGVETKEVDRQTNRPWANENMQIWVSNEWMNEYALLTKYREHAVTDMFSKHKQTINMQTGADKERKKDGRTEWSDSSRSSSFRGDEGKCWGSGSAAAAVWVVLQQAGQGEGSVVGVQYN